MLIPLLAAIRSGTFRPDDQSTGVFVFNTPLSQVQEPAPRFVESTGLTTSSDAEMEPEDVADGQLFMHRRYATIHSISDA
eukprot:1135420-Amphidinium_carterae.1